MTDPRAIAEALFSAEGTGGAWNLQILDVADGYARVAMQIRPDMTNGHGTVHGGMTFALADSAFAYACNSHNVRTVGQAASIVYLAPARVGETLIAEAQMVARQGRSGVCNVVITAEDGRVIATFQGQSREVGGPLIEG
ncbi:acyl-CoA thioesterase [Novosphingobium sp. 1529]|uniref:hydroxyphenylacetyl-CoA thioesterase PaaI n=1 Tax=Novosphingobium sp. 1529 TaxID=3156424 RepID=UPI00145B4318